MVSIEALLIATAINNRNAGDPFTIAVYRFHPMPKVNRLPSFFEHFGNALRHLTWPEPGIVELFDQCRDLIFTGQKLGSEHRKSRFTQIQVLDSLRRPICPDLSALRAPYLFDVGLEEHLQQSLAKAIGDPLFKVFLFTGGERLRFNIT
jgi:hypothetical protein